MIILCAFVIREGYYNVFKWRLKGVGGRLGVDADGFGLLPNEGGAMVIVTITAAWAG